LDEYAEQQQLMASIKDDIDKKKKLDDYVQKYHYLQSTECQPGVFNSPYKA
jgi:hypothetical protein